MSILTLYFLLTLLPNMDMAIDISIGILVVAAVVFAICYSVEFDDKSKEPYLKFLKNMITALIYLIILGVFVPGKEQIVTMVGGYAVTNDQEMKKLPDNILKAANTYLERMTVDPKKKEKQ